MTPRLVPNFIPRFLSPKAFDSWFGHLAFGHDLAAALRPSLYVCLGVTTGDDYFGVCQTVLEEGLECTCYGALSEDDPQAGEAAEIAFYNGDHYRGFSYLSTLDEDLIQSFSTGTIDVLQIANSRRAGQIFEAWLPKVKPGGVILVERIAERSSDGHTWHLWEQIESTFHDSFAFHHAEGLGIVRKPGVNESSSFLDNLFDSSNESREYIRRHYVIYSGYLDSILRRDRAVEDFDRKVGEVTTELRAAQHERMILEAELAQIQLELTRTQYERSEAGRKIKELQDSVAAAEAAHEAARMQMQQVSEALQAEQRAKRDLMESFSWKLTAPARDFMEWARRRKAE